MKKIWFVLFCCFWMGQVSHASESGVVILKTMTERLVKINTAIGIEELSYDLFYDQLSGLLIPIKNKTATSFDFKRYTILIIQNPLNSLKASPGNLVSYYKLLETKKISELALIFGYDSILLHKYDQALVYLNYFLKQNQNIRLSQEVRLKIGEVHHRLGEYKKSHLVLDALMDECVADKSRFPVDFPERIYQVKALNYRQQGNIFQAERTYLAIMELVAEQQIIHRMAELKNQLALFYLETGNYDKALDCLNSALDLLKETISDSTTHFNTDKDSFETVYIYSITLQYMGLVNLQLNQVNDAQMSIKKSIDYFGLLSSRKDTPYNTQAISKIWYNQCYGYNLLGQLYARNQDYDAASDAIGNAMRIAQNSNYFRGKIDALTGIAGIEHEKGNVDQTLKYLKNALSLIEKNNKESDFRLIIPVLIGMAEALKNQSDFQAANIFYDQAIKISIENKINFFSWELYKGKAQIFIALDDDKKACENYEQAIKLIENTRFSLSDETIKYSYMKDKFFVYDDFIKLLINLHKKLPQKGYDKKAFEIFEKKQARIFLEKIGKSISEKSAGVPSELIFKKESLENDRYFLVQKLTGHQFLNAQLKKDDEIAQLKIKIDQNKVELDKITLEIKRINPNFFQLRYPQPLKLETIQNQLLKPDDLVLVYHVTEDAVGLWVIDKTNSSYFDLPLTQTSLRSALGQLYNDLSYEKVFNFDDSLHRFNDNAFKLSEKLIPNSIREIIRKKRHLYVVPTQELYGLAFETLVMENKEEKVRYLIEDIPIAYLSSSALLSLFPQENRKQQPSNHSLLAFGNPDYSAGNQTPKSSLPSSAQLLKKNVYLKITRAVNESGRFDQLPQTESEVVEIAKIMGIDKVSEVLNFGINASESHIDRLNETGELQNYNFLIFACHGILPGEIEGLKEPAIILSQPDPFKMYDGFLTMEEVFGLKMHADLTLLSACSTGGGTLYAGEGVRGMARAFMYAGSSAVAVNLWKVDSRAARLNSVDFFQYIAKGEEKSNALRQAKLNMIHKRHGLKYMHPFFWGAMILFGNGHN